jgi:hypothetical protein
MTTRNLYPDLAFAVLADTEKKCGICDKAFENSDELNQHIQSHQDKPSKVKKTVSKSSRYKATGVAAAIAVIVVLAVYFSESPSSPTHLVQGVQCDPLEGTVFHIHAHLDVIVNGKSVEVPSGIGIKPNECLYWLHTHNTSGVIHIESPTQTKFTLLQFIQVWDNTPGISPSFEQLTNHDKNFKVFVNGIEFKDSYDKVSLNAHDEIVIVSGSVPLSIPSTYAFGGL